MDKLGIARATFYRWYDLYRLGGIAALEDHRPTAGHVWNRIPDHVRHEIVDLALDIPELSPRELAVKFTDTKRYFVSESSVYCLLKAHDLITQSNRSQSGGTPSMMFQNVWVSAHTLFTDGYRLWVAVRNLKATIAAQRRLEGIMQSHVKRQKDYHPLPLIKAVRHSLFANL